MRGTQSITHGVRASFTPLPELAFAASVPLTRLSGETLFAGRSATGGQEGTGPRFRSKTRPLRTPASAPRFYTELRGVCAHEQGL